MSHRKCHLNHWRTDDAGGRAAETVPPRRAASSRPGARAGRWRRAACTLVALLSVPALAAADETDRANVGYGKKGWELTSRDGNYGIAVRSRLQFRFASPFDSDPVSFDDLLEEDTRSLKINRARLKVGGHAYRPWLRYYWEYELAASALLDFRLMIARLPWLQIKVGQWKAQYSRVHHRPPAGGFPVRPPRGCRRGGLQLLGLGLLRDRSRRERQR
jgi:hypothetical protein